MILAGDIGGTKTALAVLDETSATRRIVREVTLPSREIESFEDAAATFIGGAPALRVRAACFGVAGPVVDGRCVTTNLPWELEESKLAGVLGCPVRLINDLEAAATGVLDLQDEDFLILQAGQRRSARHMAMIAAGTGLGEAFMIWDGARYRVVASEGGHVDFAPRDELEVDLLRFLRAEFGHVSYERVLSGPGLHHIYRFLQMRAGHAAPDWLRHRLGSEDPSAVISEVALAGGDPVCVEALDHFVSVYGSEAGNLALKAVAMGGVVVGGGIAPRIRARLTDGRFVKAFLAKGRFGELLSTVPVKVSLDPRAPLWGAARLAGEMARS
jgi:glucokinase